MKNPILKENKNIYPNVSYTSISKMRMKNKKLLESPDRKRHQDPASEYQDQLIDKLYRDEHRNSGKNLKN